MDTSASVFSLRFAFVRALPTHPSSPVHRRTQVALVSLRTVFRCEIVLAPMASCRILCSVLGGSPFVGLFQCQALYGHHDGISLDAIGGVSLPHDDWRGAELGPCGSGGCLHNSVAGQALATPVPRPMVSITLPAYVLGFVKSACSYHRFCKPPVGKNSWLSPTCG